MLFYPNRGLAIAVIRFILIISGYIKYVRGGFLKRGK